MSVCVSLSVCVCVSLCVCVCVCVSTDLRYEEPLHQVKVCRWDEASLLSKRHVLVKRPRVADLLPTPPPPPRRAPIPLLLPLGEGGDCLQVYSRQTSMVVRTTQALEMEVAREQGARALRQGAAVQWNAIQSGMKIFSIFRLFRIFLVGCPYFLGVSVFFRFSKITNKKTNKN